MPVEWDSVAKRKEIANGELFVVSKNHFPIYKKVARAFSGYPNLASAIDVFQTSTTLDSQRYPWAPKKEDVDAYMRGELHTVDHFFSAVDAVIELEKQLDTKNIEGKQKDRIIDAAIEGISAAFSAYLE